MEDDVINRLITWADRQPSVRVVLLTSSQAGNQAPVDVFSDYDVELYVTDIRPFIDDEGWLRDFGTILVMCRDQWEDGGERQYSRLVRYDNGTRIDFVIAPVTVLQKILDEPVLPEEFDIGYRVLLDKDQLTGRMLPPSYKAYIPTKPTEQQFMDRVEGFWWDCTYVAKYLCRDDLFPAKYTLDYDIRFLHLRQVLEWSVEIAHNWSLPAGIHGRWLKRRLPPEVWSAVEETFAGAAIEDNWRALFRTIEVFRATALAVARDLGYEYPQELDANVSAYLRKCQTIGKDQ